MNFKTKQDNNSLRREKINIMLTKEERQTIIDKAIKYGFGDCLAEYVRSACIYENIYVEDVDGKIEVCSIVNQFITEIRQILKFQKLISMNINIAKDDILTIKNQNQYIMKLLKDLSRIVTSSLSVRISSRCQQRLNILDYHKMDSLFIDKIKKLKVSIIRPSNLNVISIKKGFLIKLRKYNLSFNANDIYESNFVNSMNQLRKEAMENKLYLLFYVHNDKVDVNLVKNFLAKKDVDSFIEKNSKICIIPEIELPLNEEKENSYNC